MLRMSIPMCESVWRRNARAVIDKWAERMLQLFGQRKASFLLVDKLKTGPLLQGLCVGLYDTRVVSI